MSFTGAVKCGIAAGAAFVLGAPAVAQAAPSLSIAATHAPATFLKTTAPNTTVYEGTLTLTVTNTGADPTDGSPVTVTDALPAGLGALVDNAGLGAGPLAASGPGWSCTGGSTSRCTRSDVLTPGTAYPPITITTSVATSAAASLANAPGVSGGGSPTTATASDTIPVATDACPNGWGTDVHVAFGPPAPWVDSGVTNPERADGCSLLDVIWSGEPFASHDAFVSAVAADAASFVSAGLLTPSDADRVAAAAARSGVGGPDDHELPNTCAKRIALTMDDGPSAYRPQTLQNLRDEQVPATFFELGVRMLANPQLDRFEEAEGHTVLLHTFDHANLNNVPLSVQQVEVRDTAAQFAANGVPLRYNVLRPPYLSINAATAASLNAMGFTPVPTPIFTTDWLPTNTAAQTASAILKALRPGGEILVHDGPIDSPAGQATVDAEKLIIDGARAAGYCFGTIDRAGNVAADRYVPTTNPIPPIVNPVPYIPLAGYTGTPPAPWYLVPQPLQVRAAHSPAVLAPGGSGTLTLTVYDPLATPTDGSTTTVTDALPAGLTATSAGGPGWTCSGTATVTCTRGDVLAGEAAFPPITIAVSVASGARPNLANAARVTGRGGTVWVGDATDTVQIGVPASGTVGGSVPATLSLTLGAAPTFGAFTPGVAHDYTTSTTATVTSTAGDAALSVYDPDTAHQGRLVNGAYALAQALQVDASSAHGTGGAFAPLGASPLTLLTYAAPVSNDAVAVGFKQPIAASDPLRTGAYVKTLTFTLSTTAP